MYLKVAVKVINILTALLALGSAYCWYQSCKASVTKGVEGRPDGAYHDGTVIVSGTDYFATVKLQARWNSWAAAFATCAAIGQAIVAALGTGDDGNESHA